MREIKEILVLIRDNKHLYNTYSNELGARIAGICDIAEHLLFESIMTRCEHSLFLDFMNSSHLKKHWGYWWLDDSPKRWEWLDEQIEKL